MAYSNRERSRRRKKRQGFGRGIIVMAVMALIAVMIMLSIRLNRKIDQFAAQEEVLEEQIAEEKARTEEMKSLPDYIKSDVFIEQAARDKFGLVYDDEIVFKAEE